jgi:acyl carrier protein
MGEDRDGALKVICRICEQMFGEQDLTGAENFFELGGTSLDAVELITVLKENHGFLIEYANVFEAETLAQLAGEIAGIARPAPS